MISYKVQLSGVNTYKLRTLSSDEMQLLFLKIKEGDAQAREKLVECNLRLVLSILQRFKNRGEPLDDLFQVGCIGLIKAIDNFQLEQEVNFSTYAVPMIIGEIKRYLRDNNSIHISRSVKSLAQKIQQTREKLINRNCREPNISELAREMDLSPEEVVFAYNAVQEPVSLHDPVYNDSTDPVYVMDTISDTSSGCEKWLDNLALQEALSRLAPREKSILEARFIKGQTQVEIARQVGISQAQVSRVEKAALKLIRQYCSSSEHGERI